MAIPATSFSRDIRPSLYSPLTLVRATVEAEMVVVSDDRGRLIEFQFGP